MTMMTHAPRAPDPAWGITHNAGMPRAVAEDPFEDDLAALRSRRSAKWRAFPPDVLPAAVAEMDTRLAPCVAEELGAAVARSDCGYAVWDGLPEVFAGWAARRFGWSPDPGAVVVLPDVVAAIGETLRLLTAAGDRVVIMPPVYPPFWRVVEDSGRQVAEVPLAGDRNGWRLDLEALAAALRAGARAVLLCSPHNPVGAVWPGDELRALAGLAAEHGALVICDEIHAPLTMPGARHVAYGTLGETHAVVVTSPSKAFNLAGLKCAFAVGCSAGTAAALEGIPLEARNATGHLGVLAAAAAMRDGDGWLDGLISRIAGNHELLADLLDRGAVPGVRFRRPDAGYLAWLDCREAGLGRDPAAAFLQHGRVGLSSGPDFGRQGEGFARLNLGTSPALVREAVRRMGLAKPATPAAAHRPPRPAR